MRKFLFFLLFGIMITCSIQLFGVEKLFIWENPKFKNSTEFNIQYIEIKTTAMGKEATAIFDSKAKNDSILSKNKTEELTGKVIFGLNSESGQETDVSVFIKGTDDEASYKFSGTMDYSNTDDKNYDWKNVNDNISQKSEIEFSYNVNKFILNIRFSHENDKGFYQIPYNITLQLEYEKDGRKLLMF